MLGIVTQPPSIWLDHGQKYEIQRTPSLHSQSKCSDGQEDPWRQRKVPLNFYSPVIFNLDFNPSTEGTFIDLIARF